MVVLSDCSIEHWYYQLLSFVQSIVREWRVGSVGSVGSVGRVGRWGDGEMGRWGDGEMGRWGDGEGGEMGRWGGWGGHAVYVTGYALPSSYETNRYGNK
ncbi:MAG: hypothetical protein F6K57_25765, partial [Moorea sp. SIO4A5]|nr:hypothetical protein [Moorena sp. SIO4A5]